jgi:hypothetical protein
MSVVQSYQIHLRFSLTRCICGSVLPDASAVQSYLMHLRFNLTRFICGAVLPDSSAVQSYQMHLRFNLSAYNFSHKVKGQEEDQDQKDLNPGTGYQGLLTC